MEGARVISRAVVLHTTPYATPPLFYLFTHLALPPRVRAPLQQVRHDVVKPARGRHHQGGVPVVVRLLQIGLCVNV